MNADLFQIARIAPSILSADFGRLREAVAVIMDAGALVVHVDVMDGHFVPNITVGPLVVAALEGLVHQRGGVLDVHLMIEEPERYVDRFAAAGADILSVHQEACVHLHRVLGQIREAGPLAGVALNPATPVGTLEEIAPYCDAVLVMSVNPGFGGQAFIPTSTAKVAAVRALLPADVIIGVDGGVDEGNAAALRAAGARLLVAGSSVFGAADPAAALQRLQAAAGG